MHSWYWEIALSSRPQSPKKTNRFNIDGEYHSMHPIFFFFFFRFFNCIFLLSASTAVAAVPSLSVEFSACLLVFFRRRRRWILFFFVDEFICFAQNIVRSMAQVLPHDDSVDRFARERIIIQNKERNEMHFAKRHTNRTAKKMNIKKKEHSHIELKKKK